MRTNTQIKICNLRDDISSYRSEISDSENNLLRVKKNWEDEISECNHTYQYDYECRINGTSAIEDGKCYLCQDVF